MIIWLSLVNLKSYENIQDFPFRGFEQVLNQKDRIFVGISLQPYFPIKNFLIKMDGQKEDDGNDWDTEYSNVYFLVRFCISII